MTGNAQKQILRITGLTVTILVLCGAIASAQGQKISPLSDYQYKKDLELVEQFQKEADPETRAGLLLAFQQERPISRMLLYVQAYYMDCIKPYISKKDWSKVIKMEEAFLALVPSEKTVRDAQIPVGVDEFVKTQLIPTQKTLMSSLMAAYFQANNLPKAAEMGEKVYALDPQKAMLPTMADIYLKMQNTDKYLSYAEKIVAEYPIDQSYPTALQMAQMYLKKQDVNKARALFSKVMDAYGDKLPPNVQESAWNATRAVCYGVIAAGFYANKNYSKAQELYEKVAKFDPKRDDAYYYIAMCKWNAKDQEGAISDFAKAVVLGKTNAQKAREYMENLYKAEHSDSLDGIDDVLARAKSELGM